ncbi:MAG: hypothetical protein HQK52_09190 [Oligoflexia bacterium]|nr:hypothetical protein [Oligoflexia bacterium]
MKNGSSFVSKGLLALIGIGFSINSSFAAPMALPPEELNTQGLSNKVQSFMSSLVLYKDTDDPNLLWWTPTLRVGRNGASMFEEEDAMEVFRDTRKWNKRVKDVTDALADEAFKTGPFSGNTDSAFTAATVPTYASEKDSLTPTPLKFPYQVEAVAGQTVDRAFAYLNATQKDLYKTGIIQAFIVNGFVAPSDVDDGQLKTLVRRSKTLGRHKFGISLVSGFTEEQIAFFNEFRAKNPHLRFQKLSSLEPVTLTLQNLSQRAVTDNTGTTVESSPIDSVIFGADLFRNGRFSISLNGGTIEFEMSNVGFNSLKSHARAKKPYNLPIRAVTKVFIPNTISATLKCHFDTRLAGDLKVELKKYANDDLYFPVTDKPQFSADNISCNDDKLREDGKFDASELNLIQDAKQRFVSEFMQLKQASLQMRDEMLEQLINQEAGHHKSVMPEQWHQIWGKHLSNECKRVITTVCVNKIFGACLARVSREHQECRTIEHLVLQYYKTQMPFHYIRKKEFDQQVVLDREFTYNVDKNFDRMVDLPDQICVKFTNDDERPGIPCQNSEEYDQGNSNSKIETRESTSGDLTPS